MIRHQLKQILSTLLVIAMLTGSFCGVIPSVENISNYIESVSDGEVDEELLHSRADASTSCQSTTYHMALCPEWRSVHVGRVPLYVCECGNSYNTLTELDEHISYWNAKGENHYNGYSKNKKFANKNDYPYVINACQSNAYVAKPCSTCNGKGYLANICEHGHTYSGTVTYQGSATTGGVGGACGASCDSCVVVKYTVGVYYYLQKADGTAVSMI